MTVVNWRNIVDEVRCWDATDLLHNLDDELENARKGFTNCLLCIKDGEEKGAPLLLKPEISIKNEHLYISFSDLEGVDKGDIDVSIENGEIFVNVEIENEEGGTSLGWFRMRIPHDFDAETCEAEHCEGTLTLLLRRKKSQPIRKNIKLK